MSGLSSPGTGGVAFTHKNTSITATGPVNSHNIVNVTTQYYSGSTSSIVEKIVSWLCIEQHKARHDEHHMRRAKGTLEGFLKSDVYTSWVKGEGTQCLHLECRGMPGAGKSTVASAVVEDLQDQLSSTSNLVVYAYFRYDSQSNQTPEFVIPHLLGQAVKRCREVSAQVLALYDEYYKPDAKTVPRLDKTIDAFLLAVSGRKLYIVLDALDEFSVEHYDNVLPLINTLEPLKAKLLVTSRHAVPLPATTFRTFEVRADSTDVRILIMKHVKNHQRLAKFIKDSPELLEEIVTKISERTCGMFIIVPLQLYLLSSQMTPHGVRRELNHLPAGLDRTYELAMERIHQQSPELVRIADESFGWVFYAEETLSTKELQHGVSFDTTERRIGSEYLIPIEDILAACCGLIVVVDDKCQFVHFSMKEFFRKYEEKYLPGAERKITEKCLCYAAVAAAQLAELNSDKAIKSRISDMRLCQYASSYWGLHASHLLEGCNQLESLVDDLIKQAHWPEMADDIHYRWRIDILDASNLPSQHYLILYLARYGLIDLLQSYWNRNALSVAAAISEGRFFDNPNLARADSYDGDEEGAAIHFAAKYNHKENVQFLIEQGVNVNLTTEQGRTALHIAAWDGYDSIAQTLLDNGADPYAQDSSGDAPLHDAVYGGHLSLVQLLLNNGADVNRQNKDGETSLHEASARGHASLLPVLLDAGADPDVQTHDGRTPLHYAARADHTKVISLLIERGADLLVIDKDGDTALDDALDKEHADIVNLIVIALIKKYWPRAASLTASQDFKSSVYVYRRPEVGENK